MGAAPPGPARAPRARRPCRSAAAGRRARAPPRARAGARGRRRGRRGGRPPRRRGSRAAPCAVRGASACASQSCISRRVSASSAANGSSRHSSGLPDSSVRRKATRWRMPPESSWGRARSKPSRPKAAKSGCARARASARDAPPRRRASAALSSARSHGSRLSRWGMSTAGSARTRPASGACSPHTSSSSVVLPQPLGPTTATISPAPTSRSTPSSARTEPNARLTPARLAVPPPSTFRGSCAGASSLVVIAPSAGITPQVRRVSAGSLGAISAGLRQPPCWSAMDASAGARRRASPRR